MRFIKKKKLNLSKALQYYINKTEIINLITYTDLEKNKNKYKKYLKDNKVCNEIDYLESEEDKCHSKSNISERSENSSSDEDDYYNSNNNNKDDHHKDDEDDEGDINNTVFFEIYSRFF